MHDEEAIEDGRVDHEVAVAVVLDLEMVTGLDEDELDRLDGLDGLGGLDGRSGKFLALLAGGSGSGGSAGFVFSYRRPTMWLSSRNNSFPPPPTAVRPFWRTDEKRLGGIWSDGVMVFLSVWQDQWSLRLWCKDVVP